MWLFTDSTDKNTLYVRKVEVQFMFFLRKYIQKRVVITKYDNYIFFTLKASNDIMWK